MQQSAGAGRGGAGMALAGVVLGPALQLQQEALWDGWAYGVLAVAGILLLMPGLARRARGCGTAHGSRLKPAMASLLAGSITLAGAAALAFALVGLRACAFQSSAIDPALEGRDLALTGVVAAMPHRSEAGMRFTLRVEAARIDGAEVRVPTLVQLGWYGGVVPGPGGVMELQRPAADLRPGERWHLTARLKAPHGQANPGGFDYELWLWEQGIQATGYVRAGPKDPPPKRAGPTWRQPVEQLRHAVREAIFGRVADARVAGVIAALAVGDQGSIERADWDVFRATGVAHLMSISGLHVTMFAWLAAAVVGGAWRRSAALCLAFPAQHAALLGGVVLATAYAVFSGWGVPAQRTVWMLATVGLLRLSARDWPWPWVWLLACAVVVTLDPWALLQPGFWLSFVAVGVLFATDAGRRTPGEDTGGRGMRVARGALGLLREQGVVTLALTPLALLLFGQVSLVGLPANLVAIPWVTLLVTPLALGGALFAPLWDAAGWAVLVLGAGLQGLASWPLAMVSVAAAPPWAGAAGVLGGLLLAMPLPPHLRALGVPLLLPVLFWQPPRPPAGEFDLLAADVGQGNAVLVRTATRTLVYDAGPRYGPDSDAGHRVLVPLLRRGGERVDMLVLSHRDSDHTGGAAAVLAMQAQAAVLSSIEARHELQAARPAVRCEAGQRWQWDGVAFEVLHPSPADYLAPPKPNAVSCVLRVSNGAAAVLLAGDIELAQEVALLARRASLQADLLLVPHHGSRTSSGAQFLQAVQPRSALVQAGYRNRFGHPAAPVLERYRGHGTALVESARCGAAGWRSTRPGAVECERSLHARYWYHRPP